MRRLALATLALCALVAARPLSAVAAKPEPSLLVVIVVDQFAAHELERWAPLFKGGLAQLMRRGAVYTQARYAYANTETGAGHATAMTGAWPSAHGIVSNEWADEGTGRITYCYEDAEHGRSPARLQAPAFADQLRLATGGKSRAVAISLKDRAAIPMGGTRPRLVTWYDKKRGGFVSGKWPGLPAPPAWFAGVASKLRAESARGTTWGRFREDVDYAAHAGPDDHPAEEDVPLLGRTFPHRIPEDADPAALRSVYRATPTGMQALMTLARAALDEEKLGLRGTTDMLGIGISTTDFVGHEWGAYSQEQLDTLLRLDAMLADLFAYLARTRGRDRVVIALTADHGAVFAPEKARMLGVDAGRVSKQALTAAAEAAAKGKATVLKVDPPSLFLSPTPPEVDRRALRRRVAAALLEVRGVVEAYALDDVARFPAPYDTLFSRSLFPGRRADVLIRTRPGWYTSRVDEHGNAAGTGHGSPYVYDMAVPLMIVGPGVRPGVRRRPVDMTRMAPTLAALLGIPPPGAALQAPLDAAER